MTTVDFSVSLYSRIDKAEAVVPVSVIRNDGDIWSCAKLAVDLAIEKFAQGYLGKSAADRLSSQALLQDANRVYAAIEMKRVGKSVVGAAGLKRYKVTGQTYEANTFRIVRAVDQEDAELQASLGEKHGYYDEDFNPERADTLERLEHIFDLARNACLTAVTEDPFSKLEIVEQLKVLAGAGAEALAALALFQSVNPIAETRSVESLRNAISSAQTMTTQIEAAHTANRTAQDAERANRAAQRAPHGWHRKPRQNITEDECLKDGMTP